MTEKDRKKPGPKEERVKVKVPWEKAVKDALRRKKPHDGWPDDAKRQDSDANGS